VDLEFFQKLRRPHDKHASVPIETALFQECLGALRLRFLDEPCHSVNRGPLTEGCPRFDVAVAGFRPVGHHPESHQPARLRCLDRCFQCRPEPRGRIDQVVRREHRQYRLRLVPDRLQRRHSHSGGGVASHRFQQDPRRTQRVVSELFGHQKTMILIADHQGGGEPDVAGEPVQGLLHQGSPGGRNVQKLLGVSLPGQGPEPRPHAAGEDHGNDRWVFRRPAHAPSPCWTGATDGRPMA